MFSMLSCSSLFQLAEELLKRETLSYKEICDLIGPPAFGHKNLVDIIEFGAETNGEPISVNSTDSNPNDDSSKSNSPEK